MTNHPVVPGNTLNHQLPLLLQVCVCEQGSPVGLQGENLLTAGLFSLITSRMQQALGLLHGGRWANHDHRPLWEKLKM